MKDFNKILGDFLADKLATMGCFYIVFFISLIPLFIQPPHDLIGWISYIIQSIYQGASLPLLGYVAKLTGSKQEITLKETHDNSMQEVQMLKDEMSLVREELKVANESLEIAKQERDEMHSLVQDVHSQLKAS